MKLYLIMFVLATWQTSNINCQVTQACPSEPCLNTDPFCTSVRDPDTCECMTACCSMPYCENGYEVCDSCTNCRCKEGCPTAPCPNTDPFCFSERDNTTCECMTACCSIPFCENGYEVCDSCFNCRCKEGCPNTPCPSSSDFCYGMRDETNCQCYEICCSPPLCEESGVDWDNCRSCSHCPCLPIPETTTATKATRPPCNKVCKKRRGCKVLLNERKCKCEYFCEK